MKEELKKESSKLAYVKPECEVLTLGNQINILAGSPPVQPGGGGGGSVIVVSPEEDDDDTEISGAKKFNMWEDVGGSNLWED